MSDFENYCCLYREYSVFAQLTPKIVMDVLSKRCYIPLSMTGLSEDAQGVELLRRKSQFLLWFYRNKTIFSYDNCPIATNSELSDRVQEECSKSTEGYYNIYTALWVLLFIMIVVNNLLIIVSILKVPNLRQNVANLFILSLSVSDLFVGLFVVPFKISEFSKNSTFCFSIDICRLYLITDTTGFVISIMNLMVITFDRHLALNYPFQYPNWVTRRRAKLAILFTWFYGLCIGALVNIKFDNVTETPIIISNYSCQLNHNYIFAVILYILHYLVPVISMGIVYFRILRITKNHAKSISESVVMENNSAIISQMWAQKDLDNNNNSTPQHESIVMKDINSETSKTSVNGRRGSYSEHYTIENKKTTEVTSSNSTKTKLAALSPRLLRASRVLRRNSSKSMDQYRRVVRKATQTVAAVCGTFAFCWLPVGVLTMLLNFCKDCVDVRNWPHTYIIFFVLLPYVNSMMNAYLYAMTNNQFRKGFKKILCVATLKAYLKEKVFRQTP